MRPLRFTSLSFVTSILCIFLCSGCSNPFDDEKEAHITILYTTDVHGQIFPYDFTLDQPCKESMAHLKSYIDEVRKKNPDGTLLLDGGDLNQGTPAVYWSNNVAMREPLLVAQMLNYLDYNAITYGNHDIEAGEFVYADRMPRQARSRIVCANAIDSRTGEPMFEPYTVFNVKGFRVAILGFITPGIHQWLPKSIWPDLEFDDMIGSAHRWIKKVKDAERPDFIIGIFHAGSETYPIANIDSMRWKEDGAILTAQQIPGFDLVLMGHDHLVRQDTLVNVAGDSVCILEPSAHAEEIGRADIHIAKRRDSVYYKTISLRRVPVKDMPISKDFEQYFAKQREAVDRFLNQPVGRTKDTLNGASSLVGPSNLMDFIHQVQLEVTDAQISFASSLSIYTDIPAGDLTMRQIFSMYKYENQIHKMWMTGQDIKDFLEWGYGLQFTQMQRPDDHVLSFKLQPDGQPTVDKFGPILGTPQYNFTSAAGIKYTVDISRPAGQRVNITSLTDGTPFRLDQSYTVAINSYQAAGGGGFITRGLHWTQEDIQFHTINESTHDMCYYIAHKIQDIGSIPSLGESNWQVVPHDWWAANQKRDIDILLPYLTPRNTKPLR